MKYYLVGDDAVTAYEDGYNDFVCDDHEGIDAVIKADEENSISYDLFVYDKSIHNERYLLNVIGGRKHAELTEEEYKLLTTTEGFSSIQEVVQAVDKGLTVCWRSGAYKVVRSIDDYFVKNGKYMSSIYWADGKTSDYKPQDFFIENNTESGN